MNPQILLDLLMKKFDAKTSKELAGKLGVTEPLLSQYKGWNNLTEKSVANLIFKTHGQSKIHTCKNWITPIIEILPVEPVKVKDNKSYSIFEFGEKDRLKINNIIRKRLQRSKGVYVLYDGEGMPMYKGKARKTNLWDEINQCINRDDISMDMYFSDANARSNKSSHDILDFPIESQKVKLGLASKVKFISAYEVMPEFIDKLEALIIKITANSNINIKMEGL